MIINRSGVIIRIAVADLRIMGRATQGVRLINIKGSDSIAAVAMVMREDEEEIDENVENNLNEESHDNASETQQTETEE